MSEPRASENGGAFLPEAVDSTRGPALGARHRSDARTFARLLVSDVRLYHEQAVIEGRSHRDLASRLDAPLAAARERFLKRFPEVELFEHEVIRILAGGDSSRMG